VNLLINFVLWALRRDSYPEKPSFCGEKLPPKNEIEFISNVIGFNSQHVEWKEYTDLEYQF